MLSGFMATIWLFGQINLEFGHVLLFATDHFVVQVIQLVFCFVCVWTMRLEDVNAFDANARYLS